MSGTDCYPWWHATLQPLAEQAWAKTVIPSGCSVNSVGNVPCDPAAMTESAQAWLYKNAPQVMAMIGGHLSLEAYTLARYLHSEVGSGTIEERVAVAESAVNRARREKLSQGVLSLLLYRQPPGHPNRGWYGPIHGVGTGTSTAPYGRWAATSRDPSIMAVVLASYVINGVTGNFSKDADDQDGPEAWVSKGQTALTNYVRGLAAKGKYWVGPLPGVDHWHTFLQFTPNPILRSAMGEQWLKRGIDALTLVNGKAVRPQWPADMPVCSRGLLEGRSSGTIAVVTGVGLAAALWFGAKWWATRHRTLSA